MNKTVLVAAGILALIDAFLKSTSLNVIVFIVVGIAALYFGFKLFGKTKIGGTIAMLMGILFILFAFIKDIVRYNPAHIAVSIILGLILIAAPFIGKLVQE